MAARVPYIDRASLALQDQDLLNKNYTSFAALANSPDCMRAFWNTGAYFQTVSPLPPRLREMALLEIGRVSGCAYEWSHHVKIALAVGVTEEEIRLVTNSRGQEVPQFDPLTRATLRTTREMYEGLSASEEAVDELKRYLDAKLVVELIVLIGYYCGMVRVLSTLGVEVEQDYEEYLEWFPVPKPSLEN